MRGQVLDGAIVAVMIAVMLYLMHVPYALLIGVTAGFLNLVPYLGSIVGFIPSVTLALVTTAGRMRSELRSSAPSSNKSTEPSSCQGS